ncbi:hypothetical protein ACWD4T_02725 [Streptomyces umbrinus]
MGKPLTLNDTSFSAIAGGRRTSSVQASTAQSPAHLSRVRPGPAGVQPASSPRPLARACRAPARGAARGSDLREFLRNLLGNSRASDESAVYFCRRVGRWHDPQTPKITPHREGHPMSNTVPVLVADTMVREGLSEADTVWDADANSVAVSVTVLGFSVRNRAGRFDFVEADGTLHTRGYKSRGPVASWARKRAAETAQVTPAAEAAPVAQDAADAEAFRIKATKAHDRVVKGHKRVMAAHGQAHAAQTRAEAARERAEAAEAAETERAYVRVAEADALMWTHTPGATEYRNTLSAFVSARFDAERLPVSEACEEACAYVEAAEAATGTEYENGDGKDVPGVEQCAEDAERARKETMIKYEVFESSPWSGQWSVSRSDAETACDLICEHARNMAAAVRHAEAAAKAAEAAAEQAEVWADTAEEQTDVAQYETDALFTLGADNAQRALSRAYWGVSDAVAEAVAETAAEAAENAPSTVPSVPVAVAAPVVVERPEEAEAPVMLPAGVARWTSQEAEGTPVIVAGPRGDVEVWYAGYWEVCWGHCPMQHWHKGGTCGCSQVLRPVMLCDGENESYTWQECPECMARELKTDADTVWAAAPQGARAAAVRASVVAESWYVADEWDGGRTPDGASLDARETAALAVADTEEMVCVLEATPGATIGELGIYLHGIREAARVVESWADHVWEVDRENKRRAEAAARQAADTAAEPGLGTCTELAADVTADAATVPVDAAEAAPVATGPRVVPIAETIQRARVAQAEAEVAMWDAQTSANDLAEAYGERASLGLLWDQEEQLRKSRARASEAASHAASEAFQARVTAEAWERDTERTASDLAAMRARTARLYSGEGDDRARWVSADGRTVIALALPAEADAVTDADTRFVDVLAGAVAAKDAGRALKSADYPRKTGREERGPGADVKRAVARAGQPLVKPWAAPRIPAQGKPLDGETLAVWDATGVCAEVEAAPGVWLPQSAVCVVETGTANGWAVAMERDGSGAVTVRAAGVLARKSGPVAGEIVAVWADGMFDVHRSGAYVDGLKLDGTTELTRVLATIGQGAEAGDIMTADVPTEHSTPGHSDVVSDPGSVDTWETEGGTCAHVESPGAPDAEWGAVPVGTDPSPEMGTCTEPTDSAPESQPIDVPSESADAPTEVPAGEPCPRCDRNALHGIECTYCGHVIITALISRGPRLCPAEEKAQATGRQYCPRCFTVGVALYATMLSAGPGYVCAECYTVYGRRLPEAGPSAVKAPAGAVVRAARAARKEAEESGASVGDVHRAGEAARKAVAVAYGQRPADVISDPGSEDVWEGEGGACVGVDRPGEPDAGCGAVPVGTDPSPEMGTCTGPVVDVTPARPDVVNDPGAVDTWDGEGGAVPGAQAPRVRLAGERGHDDPYTVRPAVAEWLTAPDTNSRITELTCAGVEYRVYQAPDAVLPYTVRRTLGGADVDLGGWVGMDDVRAIVRADRRRMAALEADRRRVEQQQRRAAYRMRGEWRQTPVRLTEEDRRAIARRSEERHRPVAAELYVSPITGNAVLNYVCGTCATTHDDPLWRPQTMSGSYRTPLSVERDTLAALVEKHGWTVTGPWATHGRRGAMRAPIAPTPAYLAWAEATYGPDPATPEVGPGEHITRSQWGWWDVISKEGHRYELTWRPTLTGPVWSVRHRNADGFEAVAKTGLVGPVLTGLRVHSAERGGRSAGTGHPESVHVPLAS